MKLFSILVFIALMLPACGSLEEKHKCIAQEKEYLLLEQYKLCVSAAFVKELEVSHHTKKIENIHACMEEILEEAAYECKDE